MDTSSISQEDMRVFLDRYTAAVDGTDEDRLDDMITQFKQFFPKYKRSAKHYDADECLKLMLHLIGEAQNQAVASNAAEAATCVVDNPQDAMAKFAATNQSPVADTFYGLQQSTVQCNGCNFVSYTWSPFGSLCLEISRPRATIQECMEVYSQPEDVEIHCKQCCGSAEERIGASKRLTIVYWPRVLIVQMKQWVLKADVAQLVAQGRRKQEQLTENDYIKKPDYVMYTDTLTPGDLRLHEGVEEAPKYTLRSIIEHSGNQNRGHYTNMLVTSGGIYSVDDTKVRQARSTRSQYAYILMYCSRQSGVSFPPVPKPVHNHVTHSNVCYFNATFHFLANGPDLTRRGEGTSTGASVNDDVVEETETEWLRHGGRWTASQAVSNGRRRARTASMALTRNVRHRGQGQ